MDKFRQLLDKKKKEKGMSDVEKDAKSSVVQHMRDMAAAKMGERLGGLKKVSVMADSKEDLEKGLDKAKEIMHKMPESEEESPEHEAMESSEEEASEHEGLNPPEEKEISEMSEDELDKKIQELMEQKKKLKEDQEVR